MATIKKWEKGETVRVYVNNLLSQGYGDKVWFERAVEKDAFGSDIVVKLKDVYRGRQVKDEAYDLIDELGVKDFDELLAKA